MARQHSRSAKASRRITGRGRASDDSGWAALSGLGLLHRGPAPLCRIPLAGHTGQHRVEEALNGSSDFLQRLPLEPVLRRDPGVGSLPRRRGRGHRAGHWMRIAVKGGPVNGGPQCGAVDVSRRREQRQVGEILDP